MNEEELFLYMTQALVYNKDSVVRLLFLEEVWILTDVFAFS